MTTYYSKSGNPEVWGEKPEGYLTLEEWLELNPLPVVPVPEISDDLLTPSIESRVSVIEDLFISIMKGELDV